MEHEEEEYAGHEQDFDGFSPPVIDNDGPEDMNQMGTPMPALKIELNGSYERDNNASASNNEKRSIKLSRSMSCSQSIESFHGLQERNIQVPVIDIKNSERVEELGP